MTGFSQLKAETVNSQLCVQQWMVDDISKIL